MHILDDIFFLIFLNFTQQGARFCLRSPQDGSQGAADSFRPRRLPDFGKLIPLRSQKSNEESTFCQLLSKHFFPQIVFFVEGGAFHPLPTSQFIFYV